MSDLLIFALLVTPVLMTGAYGVWVYENVTNDDLVLLAAIGCGFWPIALPVLIWVHVSAQRKDHKEQT